MEGKPYVIRAEWDEEALVWVATSDDVPGLVTEAATIEDLLGKLRVMVPEMLEENGVISRTQGLELPIKVMAERVERVRSVA